MYNPFYFTTFGEVRKLETIFTRENVNSGHGKPSCGGIVRSAEMGRMPWGDSRLPYFLKYDENLEWGRDETPCILWISKEKGRYRKIQVAGIFDITEVKTHPVRILLTDSITVNIGGKRLFRERISNFRFSDITLRNISRVAENTEETWFEAGKPAKTIA